MSKNGYNDFFKKAKQNATQTQPQVNQKNIISQQYKKNISQNKKMKRKFPIVQFSLFLFLSGALFLTIENFDDIDQIVKKVEISFGIAEAQSSKSVSETSKVQDQKTKDPNAQNPMESKPSSEVTSNTNEDLTKATSGVSEDSDFLFQLTERKKSLDQKEEELNKKAEEIEKQKLAVEQKLKELEDYRAKISLMLEERVKTDSAKIDNLVQVYSNMKPSQTAKIFETMDEDLVIEILTRMKKKNAADVLNLIKAEKAQLFAERYTGYRGPANEKVNKNSNNNSNMNSSEQGNGESNSSE